MQTLEAGSRQTGQTGQTGFTLLELLVVVSIIAIASAGVSFAIRDSSETKLENEAVRLAALLDTARAQSRLTGTAVVWRVTPEGFTFDGLAARSLPERWLEVGISVTSPRAKETQTTFPVLLLGPEPVIGPQEVVIASANNPAIRYRVSTNGLEAFGVQRVQAKQGAGNP